MSSFSLEWENDVHLSLPFPPFKETAVTKAEKKAAREAKLKKAQAIIAQAKSAGVDLTAEQTAEVTQLTAEARELKTQIEAADASDAMAAEVEAELAANAAVPAPRSVPTAATAAPVSGPRVENVTDRRAADPTRGFRSAGDFGAAVQAAFSPDRRTAIDSRLLIGAAATGMEQATGPNGGFLVPPAFSTAIWDGMNRQADNLLGRTDQYTIEGESLTFNANAETSRANGSRWGGAQAYWLAEGNQLTGSKPTFRQVKLEPQQLAVLVYATDKLLRNSTIALGQYLTKVASDEIAFLIGDSIINGSGVGKPKGVLNGTAETSSPRVAVAKETGQAAATIVKANIDKMWSRMHPRSRANAVWFINQDIEPQLENLSMAIGTGGVPVYLPAGGITESPYARLKGRPVIPIEYCPTLGTEGDIICADMSCYATGVQGGLEAAMSMHLRFDYAETAFRFMFAVDGQPWLAAPITPFKGTNKLSPFVTLATR